VSNNTTLSSVNYLRFLPHRAFAALAAIWDGLRAMARRMRAMPPHRPANRPKCNGMGVLGRIDNRFRLLDRVEFRTMIFGTLRLDWADAMSFGGVLESAWSPNHRKGPPWRPPASKSRSAKSFVLRQNIRK